ncbi:antitoxin Xre/MbcA/ParS toxin-binding domain-containing protein [Methylocystis iwaonis]|uniref:antitoxin Xre/MbcA/ParS toxin-binding domain-containing protein n=1 Tax=Methylocystis iwaonis TaxID=2885079 RepID=UPI002E7B3F54|nr:antitoxin Xre/MbcA/ParS toxin-binding domain-containing protein [Methylocystis iwaonis]
MSDEGFKNRRKSGGGLKAQSVTAESRHVVHRLAYFYTPEETRLWLHTPHPMLKSERAIALVNAGRTQEVLAVIDALASGAYV